MADFHFLRLEKVNVMRYLPKFLAGDMSFKDVQDTLSAEHERYRLLLPEITKQFFIETATWGLPSWEDVYQTNPPYDASIELRRTLVKAKMLGRQPATKLRIERLVNTFTKGGDAYVEEDVAPGSFRLHFPSIILWQEQLEEALDAAVPAHLMYDLHFEKDKADAVLYYASAPTIHTTYEIRPAEITDATAEARRYIGVAVSTHTAYEVYPDTVRDAAIGSALYAGGVGSIYKVLEVTQT
ncbi:MAG: putative phage tail protein [Selenomonas massiliensis]